MSNFLDRITKLPPKRLALLAAELNSRLEAAEKRALEPVAIVGIGCRFPCGANTPEEFWQFLRNGADAVTEIPPERWDIGEYFDPNPDTPGKMATRWGSFLADVDRFDARFFGIAPREALGLDPHQRLLLEVAWEALEHAGQNPEGLVNSQTGVFVGPTNSDYYRLLLERGPEAADAYFVSGNAPSMSAGRLSYFFGFRGPSLTVDTACSSSLVAVHLACQALVAGDCRMALAGAANLILAPENMVGLSRAHMLSADGKCKAFDAAADGIVRGEGCSVIVLKRLADARQDGDRVLAVVLGTAINQDGRSNGITAPNGPAQEAVIRAALERSGVQPADVDYVEAHGTGTRLGDPIEMRALGTVFGEGRPSSRPLKVGSVKTNLGHLEVTAGVAGLVKVVLALQHAEIPAHLHLTSPNPLIEWNTLPVVVPTTTEPWLRAESRRRIAGVSSFGFSGTNAHAVLAEPPAEPPAQTAGEDERPRHLLAISARTPAALRVMAARLSQDIDLHPDRPIADVCFSANGGRAHFAERGAVIASDNASLRQRLVAIAEGRTDAGVITGRAEGSEPPPVAFLFTGQGAQYVNMGRELFQTQPAFRRALECCDEVFRRIVGERLIDTLYPANSMEEGARARIDQTGFTQPALFAIEYALAELWRSWGIVPSVVLGHSVGEYVAACVAGMMPMEDGLSLTIERARLMQALPVGGAMAAILGDEERVAAACAEYARTVSIAAVNGPRNVVVSGAAADVEAIRLRMAEAGIESRPLAVSHAFHSPAVEPMLDALERAASRVAYAKPKLDVVSNLTGRLLRAGDVTADYWRRHAREAVRFADGVRTVTAHGCRVLVELGPAPILTGMASECLTAGDAVLIPTLRRGRSDLEQLFAALGRVYAGGGRVDWKGFEQGASRRIVSLPSYPFERERFWPERRPTATADRPEPWREWFYEFEWKGVGGGAATTPLSFEPSAIAAQVQGEVDALWREHGVGVYDELYPKLDAVCASYIVKGLGELGCALRTGDRLDVNALRERCGVGSQHARLWNRLFATLAEDGLLRPDGEDAWVVVREPAASDPDAAMAQLLTEFPQCRAELGFTAQAAPALAAVLTGRRDAIDVLFPAGSLQAAEALYERAPALRVFNTLVARAVAAAAAGAPATRELRILELGAGTGGTSSYVLETLSRAGLRYVFTDISPLFTARASEKFKQYDFVEYRTLNIEEDPSAQGFTAGTFDLVLAANVLHATADLNQTLAHARKLLTPGGLLVILESTRKQRFGDLTVGYTDGWWRFADDIRTDYALLSPERWLEVLRTAGFDSPTMLPADARDRAVFMNQSVFIASTPTSSVAPTDQGGLANELWVVCGEFSETTAAIASEIDVRGGESVVVGDDLLEPLQATELVETLRPRVNGRRWGVIFATGGRITGIHDPLQRVEAAVERSCAPALHLAQALATSEMNPLPRIVFATQGAQAVRASETGDPAQATLWGLGRVIELEHPELVCLRVDLPARPDTADVRALVDALAGGNARADARETQLAIRDGGTAVLRVVRSSVADAKPGAPRIRADASYLVTGGLAGLGLLAAEWLVDSGAKRLVLMARHEPTPEARQAIASLEARGVSVSICCGDVSVPTDVKRAISLASATGSLLRGVIHSAGSLDDGILLQQRWDRFASVMRAKLRGSWLLHEATSGLDLDFFVLFSSGASFLGSPGQANHAAANAFLDALAVERRAAGLPALSINWGAWSEVGAATRGGVVQRVIRRGLFPIDPNRGLLVLAHLMGADPVQTAVLPINWPEFTAGFPGGVAPTLFEAVAPGGQAAKPQRVGEQAAQVGFVEALAGQPPARARVMLAERLGAEAARVLGLNPNEPIDPLQPLNALGMDSLMAVELRNALGTLAGRQLPATLLFNYPTLGELVEYFATLAAPVGESALPAPNSMRPASLDALSEDELATLLAGKLNEV